MRRPQPDAATLETLRARAEQLAMDTTLKHASDPMSLVVVSIGNERVAIPTADLAFVVRLGRVVPMPYLQSRPWIRGLAYARGEIIGVADLARLWSIEGPSDGELLAVVEGPAGRLGVVINGLNDFLDVEKSELCAVTPKPALVGERPCRLATRDMIAILDVDALLKSPAIRVESNAAPASAS